MSDNKDIFQYHDGEKQRWGDPMAIRRRLVLACGGSFQRLWEDYFPDLSKVGLPPEEGGLTPERAASLLLARATAGEKFLPAVRQAFQMVAFDEATGAGATEQHCEDAARAFGQFCEDAKKKLGNSATSSAPTTSSPGP
jgi:hypothetical protein